MKKNQKDLNDAFLVACFEGNIEEIKKTVSKGADVNVSSQDGTNGLLFAIMSEKEQAALTVIKLGADVKKKFGDDITPLHIAAAFGQVGTARSLIAKGADINAVESKYGFTPLMSAVYYNINIESQKNMVAYLLESGADVSKVSSFGLDASLLAKDNEVVNMLKEAAQAKPVAKAQIPMQAIQKRNGRQGR